MYNTVTLGKENKTLAYRISNQNNVLIYIKERKHTPLMIQVT